MKIGIIGAGNIGGNIARKLSAAGHTVRISDARGTEAIQALAKDTGATAVPVVEAAKDVEVVILSIPYQGIRDLPKEVLAGPSDDLIVVDTGNYYPGMRDDRIEAIEAGMPESQWVSEQIGRPVVKAFNNQVAYTQVNTGLPSGAEGRIAMAVSGDNPQAKAVIISLVDAAGFDGVDAGTLAESWRHQPGTPAYCTELGADELRRALAAADKTQAPHLRDAGMQKVGQLGEGFTHEDVIRLNRSMFPGFFETVDRS